MPDSGESKPFEPLRSFELLYEEWSGPIYRYLVRLAGPGRSADLFQDTWLRVIEHHQQLRDSRQFAPWIYRIARNLVLNEARAGRRRGQVWNISSLSSLEGEDGLELEDLEEQSGNDKPHALTQAIDSQRRKIINEAIAQLDPQTREMLHLRYFDQLTLAEVAAVLEVPLGTVCTKVHRGLKAIRMKLEALGYQSLETL